MNDNEKLIQKAIDERIAYHKKSLELCKTRESLGGVKAEESLMWKEAVSALAALGVEAQP